MKDRRFFQGLQGKLLLFFLVMALVPLLLVSTLSFQRSKASLQVMGQEMLSGTIEGMMGSLDIMMNDRQNDIKAWASMPVLSEALRTRQYHEAGSFLANINKGYELYKLVMLFDAAGNLVAANDPGLLSRSDVQRNQADRAWFKQSLNGEVTVSDVAYSETAKDRVLSFSAPVKGAGGRVLGVVTSRMSWSIIEKIVDEAKNGQTGYAYLINKDGVIIAHPKKEKILKENLLTGPNKELSEIVKLMVKGERGVGEYSFEGVRKLTAYTASRGFGNYKGIGWSLAAVQGVNEIYAPVIALRNIMLGLVFVTVIVVAVLALLVARSIAGPMLGAVAFAQTVASGDLTQSLEARSKDEVGDLAQALNAMVVRLKEMIGRIRDTSSQVACAAEQISAGSTQLTMAAHSQASAAEQTSNTMVQMASSIESVSGNAENLASNVEEVSASVQQLGASSEQVAESSEIMASSVSETSSTIEQMTVSINMVAQNTEHLASSVTETSATIEQMAVSIEQVAGNTQELRKMADETVATVEKMAASISQVTTNVTEADAAAKMASKEGAAGQQAVQEALEAMKRVAGVIEKTADSVANLGQRSDEIGNIVKVINEIADQTNLLALNAAIEAARAGDAGRGFAVVAEEVRKLAEKSVAATKEISQVIKEVQKDTNDSVRYGEQASREAKASMDLSELAGNALNNIVRNIEQTSGLMSGIAALTADQADASGQVIKAVDRMSQSTAQVANAAREQALGSRQIRVAVENMNNITQKVTVATREQDLGSRQIRIAVENMNNVSRQVNLATREQALSARQIVLAVGNMNLMTQSVASATAEQKAGGGMVVEAMDNITDLTRENLVCVDQLAKSAQSLSLQAADLSSLVGQFKTC